MEVVYVREDAAGQGIWRDRRRHKGEKPGVLRQHRLLKHIVDQLISHLQRVSALRRDVHGQDTFYRLLTGLFKDG